jgi:hypothetical protein
LIRRSLQELRDGRYSLNYGTVSTINSYRRIDGYIDGWKPGEPTGDYVLDFMTGVLYADIAVKHARQIKDPAFVGFVLATIYFKATRRLIEMGGREQGFLDRLARLAYAGSLN